jgi:uncharacterized phage protein gp47/JayE
MAFGVTIDGFVKKRFEDIQAELRSNFRNIFGQDLDVSSSSVAGQMIDQLAINAADEWEAMQAIYTSQDPSGAEGISLDRISQLIGVTRLPATATRVKAIAYGDQGTVLPAGQIAEQFETGYQFNSEATITITRSLALEVEISVANVLDTQLYTITINGTPFTFTSDGTATAAEIIAGLKADIDGGSEPVITSLIGTEVLKIITSDYDDTFDCQIDTNLQFDLIGSEIIFNADNTGPISVPEDTLNIIITPISGWDSVNNEIQGIIGRDIETDEELRIRRRESFNIIGAGTVEAIRTRIRQEVASVTGASVIENATDITDGGGRPPHSFETIVAGGDEQEIADKIWELKPAGIATYGNITKTVVDSEGTNQTIKFSRATEKYLHLDIEFTKYTEEEFPADGIQQMKDALVAYANANYDNGVDVILDRLKTPIYTVPGVKTITIEADVTSTPGGTPSFSPNDIAIADNEVAVLADSRITITEV